MPIEVVNSVVARIKKTGKWPAMCDKAKMTMKQCGEKMAAAVSAKAKKRRALKGGATGTSAHSTYSQDPRDTYISVEDDGGIWVKVMDHDAALLGADGKPYTVDETALMATLGAWVSPAYDLRGHIDHLQEKEVAIEFMDARYDIGDGLFVKMKPEDPEVWQSVAEGVMRPSGEFVVPEDPEAVDGDGVVQFVMPTGMGLMWEGEPTSPGSGPGNPSQEAVSAEIVGGENTSEETGAEPPAAAPPEGAETAGEGDTGDQTPPAKTKESPDPVAAVQAKLDDAQKELDARQKQIDDLLGEKEEHGKAWEKLEKSEKERLAKQLPEEYDHTDVPLEQMKRDVALYQASIAKAKEQIVSGPTFQESDVLAGNELTDEEYTKLQAEEKAILGMAATIPAGFTPALPDHANYKGKK